jgi:DNA primase
MIQNSLERDVYISKVARETEVSADVLKAQINGEIRHRINSEKKSQWTAIKFAPYYSDPLVPEASKSLKEVKAEEGILAYLFRYPDKIETVAENMPEDCFITDFYRRIYNAMCRKMQDFGSFSLSVFSDEFNDEEMGRITGIEAKNKQIVITEQNLHDYIKILLDYKNDPLKNKDSFSDDDLLNIVTRKKSR